MIVDSYNGYYLRICEQTRQQGDKFLEELQVLEKIANDARHPQWKQFFIGRQLYAKEQWQKSFDILKAIDFTQENNDQEFTFLFPLVLSYLVLTTQKLKEFEHSVKFCDFIIEFSEHALTFKDIDKTTSISMESNVATAYINKASNLLNMNKIKEGLVVCDELIECFENTDLPNIQQLVQMAKQQKQQFEQDEYQQENIDASKLSAPELNNAGISLCKQGHLSQGLTLFDQCVSIYSDSDNQEELYQVATALLNQGVTLNNVKPEASIEAFDECVRRFEKSSSPDLLDLAATCLRYKAISLHSLARINEMLEVFDKIIKMFARSDEPGLQYYAAQSLIDKAGLHQEKQETAKAFVAYDKLNDLFENSRNSKLQEAVARGYVNRGAYFADQNQIDEAWGWYKKCIETFSSHQEPGVLEQVAMALLNQAGILRRKQQKKEAITLYHKCIDMCKNTNHPSLILRSGMAQFSIGVMHGEQGNIQKQKEVFEACLKYCQPFNDDENIKFFIETLNEKLNNGKNNV